MTTKIWYATEVIAPPEAREAIEYGLMEAGAGGTETNDRGENVSVVGYFEGRAEVDVIRESLVEALRIYGCPVSAIGALTVSEIADRDWLSEWKKSWQPVQVGRFIIAPPWFVSEPGVVATGPNNQFEVHDPLANARGTDTILVRINPGMAFGTGTHETTRLCLQAMDRHYRGGSFLDVGTGTGILAIAAAKMSQQADRQGGLAPIQAYDTDPDAIAIAKENAELNDVSDRIDFHAGSVGDQTPSADFVCANLTAPVIVELLPALMGASCGRLVLSGILAEQVELIQSRLGELGITQSEVNRDDEWTAVIV